MPLRVEPLTSTVLAVPTSGSVKAPVAPTVFKATASPGIMPTRIAPVVLSVAVLLPS